MAGTVLESALGIFGTVIRYRDSRNFPETFFSNLLSEAMPKQGKGEKSRQRVIDLVEALLNYPLNDTNRITHLHVSWEDKSTDLTVSATLEALRHLLKDRRSFKPNEKTSDLQVRKYIGEVLTDYLGKKLKILKDNRPETARKGCSDWNFTLKLWSKDKTENLQKLAEVWGVNGEPVISSQINSGQNTDGKSENDDVPADAPPHKAIRVAFSQLPDSIPVWKGRDELVENLTAKLVQMLPDGTSPPKVLAIIGQGGMGKTSLAVKLAEALGVNWQKSVSQKGGTLPGGDYECAMYFEAKERMSFDDVAGFLLRSEGLGIQAAEVLKTADEKIAKIMAGLQQTRCLLVLDNLESILHPAVDAGNPDCLAAAQVHRAISPDWGKLLNALVYQQHQSQTILTSREVPADLADTRYPGLAPDSELVHIEVLRGVDFAAGVEILRQRKLTDTLADLQWISQRVEGHVFLLTQLAAIGKGKPGFLRKHPELVTKNAEPMLREQLTRQSEVARDLLRRMCVLRVPIDVRGLTFLRLYADDWEKEQRLLIAGLSNKRVEFTDEEISETEKILKPLVDSSLVENVYDRNKCEDFYYIQQLTAEFMRKKYEELPKLFKRVYLFDISSIKFENFKDMSDLQAFIEPIMFALNIGDEKEHLKVVKVMVNYAFRLGAGTVMENAILQQDKLMFEGKNPASILLSIGGVHKDLGNWDEASRCFQQALAIAQKENNQSGIATSLGRLGEIERNRGNGDEAEKLFRQSLEMMTELGDRSGMASSWGVLGDIERNRGNWDEAEKLFRQSLEMMTELGDRSGMAYSWGVLGDIERNRGNWDEAEKLFRQSLEMMTELGDRSGMASSWGVLGDIERNRGNWDEAEKLYRQCLAMMTELGDRSGMASSWGVLGDIEGNRGNWDEAEKLYRQCLEMMTELGARSGMASSWRVLGDIEGNRGNWGEAEKLYRQCLEVETELGDRSGMASSWASLGHIERNRGNWDEAEKLFRQSLEVETELGDREGMASSWDVLGYIELCRDNWDEGEKLFRQSLALKTELGDRQGMASSWGVLGCIERKRGNWDEGEKLFRQSLEMMTELGARSGMATSWGVLGTIERNRGNWDEAEKLYRQSLELRTELGDREGMAKSIACLGENELGRGNLDTAEQLLTEALGKMQILGMTCYIAETNYDLARLERSRGNTEVAQQHYDTAHQIFQQLGAAKDLERIDREWHSTD
ncbi:tetratricopeptide repeat protein [Microcoleus vaginatus GB2-A3]|uniref:tetratricopeptide repeat protein n=1 Tax=Microcoleus vaginatus TaxID=119532 RepID=UPI0032A42DC0